METTEWKWEHTSTNFKLWGLTSTLTPAVETKFKVKFCKLSQYFIYICLLGLTVKKCQHKMGRGEVDPPNLRGSLLGLLTTRWTGKMGSWIETDMKSKKSSCIRLAVHDLVILICRSDLTNMLNLLLTTGWRRLTTTLPYLVCRMHLCSRHEDFSYSSDRYYWDFWKMSPTHFMYFVHLILGSLLHSLETHTDLSSYWIKFYDVNEKVIYRVSPYLSVAYLSGALAW